MLLIAIGFGMLPVAAVPSPDDLIGARLDDVAPGGARWVDALALATGPLMRDGDGWIALGPADLPNLDIGEEGQPPPETARFVDVAAAALPGSPGRYVLVADSREFHAVLAIVDLAKPPLLVAAAVLAHDRSIALEDVLDLGDGATAIRIAATHTNAGQGYRLDLLALLYAGRLDLIDTVMTLSDIGCGFERRQRSGVVVRRTASRLADLEASVVEIVTATGEACDVAPPPPSSRRVAATYRWHEVERRYRADSAALKELEAETKERF